MFYITLTGLLYYAGMEADLDISRWIGVAGARPSLPPVPTAIARTGAAAFDILGVQEVERGVEGIKKEAINFTKLLVPGSIEIQKILSGDTKQALGIPVKKKKRGRARRRKARRVGR